MTLHEVAYTLHMADPSGQLTELRQLLIASQQEQLKISRSLLEAQKALAEKNGARLVDGTGSQVVDINKH